MDQGSDFVSDFRARRIRTPITWEILSANCHEVTVVEPWASSDFLGKSWENSGRIPSSTQNPGGHLPELPGKPGNLHHQTASFAGEPIMPRERCHVTQPRATINVRCSRAGHKGTKGEGRPRNGHERRPAKDRKRWVPDLKPQFENSYHVYLLANREIDSQREQNFDGFLGSY